MTEPNDAEYGLVMPFIACQSKGGTYDDQAFVAGWTGGRLWSQFEADTCPEPVSVPHALVAQIDLVAMHFGFRSTSEPYDDTWSVVSFSRGIATDHLEDPDAA